MNIEEQEQRLDMQINYLKEKIRQCSCISMIQDLEKLEWDKSQLNTMKFKQLKNKNNGV